MRSVRASIGRSNLIIAFRSSAPRSDRGRRGKGRWGIPSLKNDVRWWRVLATGLGIGLLSYLLLFPVIFGYFLVLSVLDREVQSSVVGFGYAYGAWGMPMIHMLLTAFAASWVARRTGVAPLAHGVLTALVSVAVVQGVVLVVSPPLSPIEVTAYLVMALLGGLVGGAEARGVLAGQEALYRVSRGISCARDPGAVLSALHEYLSDSKTVGVALWQDPSGREGGLNGYPGDPETWTPRSAGRYWPAGVGFGGLDVLALAGSEPGSSTTLRPGRLPAAERAAWRERGVRSVLLVPLVSPTGQRIGVVAVASRKRWPPRSTVRACVTVGVQVALALENLRLVEEASEAGVLRERQRMAHEIHDTLAQGFTSIVMNLQAAEGVSRSEPGRARHHLDQAELTARESLAEARRLVWALRPEALEDASLPEALAKLARRWSRESGIAASVAATGAPSPLLPGIEATLFRVAQEALNNVRKHANASRVALTLSYMGDTVALDVRDDGAGFVAREVGERNGASGGFGLKGARERIEGAGGTFSVESAPGEGSTLAVELPAIPPEP